jgi:hypothetical protein
VKYIWILGRPPSKVAIAGLLWVALMREPIRYHVASVTPIYRAVGVSDTAITRPEKFGSADRNHR